MIKKHTALLACLALAVVGFIAYSYLQSDYVTQSEAATVVSNLPRLDLNVPTNNRYRLTCPGILSVFLSDDKKRVTGECLPLPSPTPKIVIPTMTSIPATPTTVVALPTATPMPGMTGVPPTSGENSMAMSAWGPTGKNVPNPRYDFCVNGSTINTATDIPVASKIGMNGAATSNTDVVAYVVQAHMRFKVKGPDGKWYPTWHKPVETFVDNGKTITCAFGHEHGRDPKLSQLWIIKQIQNYFYYDANKNGVMDAAEEAVTGLPFGYVNESMMAYASATGKPIMRHEDHVGHKVEYANGEGDIATHMENPALLTGGVRVGDLGDGVMTKDAGIRCYYLAKPHQGVSTGDAFTNNLHEVFYFASCNDAKNNNAALGEKISIAVMQGFGKAGQFTKFMPMCGSSKRGDEAEQIVLGTDSTNSVYPSGGGNREIITRDCIEKGFLVPSGTWSGNLYEAWPASLSIKDPAGNNIVSGINLLFDVEDSNRYYYPEALKAQRGYRTGANETPAPFNVGYTMDLCYDKSLAAQGRIYRGGACDSATNFGAIKSISWDSPQSGFKGLHRGMYYMPAIVNNNLKTETLYTDPFGNNAKTTQTAGFIKQQVTVGKIDYSTLITGGFLDPRVADRVHNNGGGTVHAPN